MGQAHQDEHGQADHGGGGVRVGPAAEATPHQVDHGCHRGVARHNQQEGVSSQLVTADLPLGQVVPDHLQSWFRGLWLTPPRECFP